MQMSRFNLIIYNFCNRADSYTFISPDTIVSSRALTCTSVVRLSYCKSLTCCSPGTLDGFTIDTYDDTDLVSPEGSSEG